MAATGMRLPVMLSVVSLLLTVCSAGKIVFYEDFAQDFTDGDRWVVSKSSEYEGIWKHEPIQDVPSAATKDFGLMASEKARKYAIATSLPEAVDPKVDAVVLQYDLRFKSGIECGGAYLKFLMPQSAGWTPEDFNNESPYSIMFGPDKCGSTNKVHFIFRHKDPTTGEYREHHLKNPPLVLTDKLSHVYSAVIYPNNTLKVLVDGEEKKTADLLSDDFEPPVLAPEEIDDPEDFKPAEWDDTVKIVDPEATKPEDWDEDAPLMIPDEEAVKPEGWLDDEPMEVDDPDATKPDDWDDAEDGDWEPSTIPNPKCENGPGCGEWKQAEKPNPGYKGKWKAPMINNPKYLGVWAPKRIANPAYVKMERPELEPVAAVGIEIWTMNDGFLFDNLLVTHDEAAAAEIRETSWRPKFEAETAAKKAEEEEEEKKRKQLAEERKKEGGAKKGVKAAVFDKLYKLANLPLLKTYRLQITEAIEYVEGKSEVQYGILIALGVIFTSILFSLLPKSRRKVALAPIPEPTEADKQEAEKEEKKAEAAKEEVASKKEEGAKAEVGGEEGAEEEVSATTVSEVVAETVTSAKSEIVPDGPAARTRRKSKREI